MTRRPSKAKNHQVALTSAAGDLGDHRVAPHHLRLDVSFHLILGDSDQRGERSRRISLRAGTQFRCDELFPRVGFIVTNLGTSSRAVVRF